MHDGTLVQRRAINAAARSAVTSQFISNAARVSSKRKRGLFLLSAYQNGRNARTLQQKQGDFERLPQYLCEEIAWNSAATSGNSTLKREEKRRKRARTGQGFTSSMGVRPQRRRPQQSIRRRPCLRPFVRPIPPTRPFRADHFSPLPPRQHHMPHWVP